MKKYALIGKSLSHSFSAPFFTAYFEKNRIDAVYRNIEVESIADFLPHSKEYDGFNVTIPYKEQILPLLDELDEESTRIGAVNTIKIDRLRSKMIGYNTDAYGFRQLIKPFLTNQHERAMILGTGGASKAVADVLHTIGISVITISRTPNVEKQFGYAEVNELMLNSCRLIVNCTPLGMYPDIFGSPLSSLKGVGENHLLVDLIYNPEETLLMKQFRQHGGTAINGLGMLKAQALKSYEIWTS